MWYILEKNRIIGEQINKDDAEIEMVKAVHKEVERLNKLYTDYIIDGDKVIEDGAIIFDKGHYNVILADTDYCMTDAEETPDIYYWKEKLTKYYAITETKAGQSAKILALYKKIDDNSIDAAIDEIKIIAHTYNKPDNDVVSDEQGNLYNSNELRFYEEKEEYDFENGTAFYYDGDESFSYDVYYYEIEEKEYTESEIEEFKEKNIMVWGE